MRKFINACLLPVFVSAIASIFPLLFYRGGPMLIVVVADLVSLTATMFGYYRGFVAYGTDTTKDLVAAFGVAVMCLFTSAALPLYILETGHW